MAASSVAATPATSSRTFKLRPTRRQGRTCVAPVQLQHQLEAPPEAAAEKEANRLGRQLRRWVEDEGGLVHPALELSLATDHGCRLLPISCKLQCNAQGAPHITACTIHRRQPATTHGVDCELNLRAPGLTHASRAPPLVPCVSCAGE